MSLLAGLGARYYTGDNYWQIRLVFEARRPFVIFNDYLDYISFMSVYLNIGYGFKF